MFLEQLFSTIPQIAIFAILTVGLVLSIQRLNENRQKYLLILFGFGCLQLAQLINIASNLALPWIISSASALSVPALVMLFSLPTVLLLIAGYTLLIIGIFRR